jgi:hypothetical protein
MNRKLLLTSAILLAIYNSSYAQYRVNIPLDPQITFEDPEVQGDIELIPTQINRGEQSTIKWDYKYASEINIEDVGTYSTLKGSKTINPLESRGYNVLIKSGDKSATKQLYITVVQPNQNIDFTADVYKIGVGTSTNLNWTVTGASSLAIDNGIGQQSLTGSYKVTPVSDTTYTLTAKGFIGIADKSQSVSIIVVPNATINSFSVDKEKITVGDTSVFNWDVSNAESLTLNGESVNKTTGSKPVTFNTVGAFDYKLQSTSLSGLTAYSNVKTVNVYALPVISAFSVNGKSTVDVSPSASLNFNWTTTDSKTLKLNTTAVTGNNTQLTANTSTGSTVYTLEASNEANKSVSKQVTVNVIGDPVINAITSPSPVFANTPFTLSWTGSGISKYTVKANNSAAGITTSENDVETSTSQTVIPTTDGSFTYTVAAYNTADAKKEQTKTVIVEADPTMNQLLVNGSTVISVAPNTSLNYTTPGISAGAALVGRDSTNTTTSSLPSTASATAGTTTYYGAPTKTLNSIQRFGSVKSVQVTVVAAPTIGTITAPTTVFANAPFTASWSGTDIESYSIKSNNASSGVATNDTGISTATSRNITPTAAGSYTYTITATNSVGTTTSKSFTTTVEADPTFTSFTVNGSTSAVVAAGATLNYVAGGISSGAFYQGRNSSNDTNITNPTSAPSTAGTYTYYMSAAKTVNNVNRYSALRSVSVRVVDQPTIQYLTATPAIVDAGQASTLTFSTANSSYNEINGVNMGSNASYVVNPSVTTTYTLTARNDAGQTTTKPVTVTVQNWTATTPVYGAWTNVAGKVTYACGTWSPNPSTVTTNTTFTQTANCSTDQTRTRQDRIVSSATGEVKNSGAIVNENQTIAQGASRSYGVTLSAWSGSTVSSCASWSPDPSTVNAGQVFTQTGASCSLPQTRTRTENYIDHVSGANVQVSVVVQNQTLTVGGSGYVNGTRNATGTKPVEECAYSTSPKTAWVIVTGMLPTGGGGVVGTQIFYNGANIYSGSSLATTMNVGAYNYTKSTAVNSLNFYVCRKPL